MLACGFLTTHGLHAGCASPPSLAASASAGSCALSTGNYLNSGQSCNVTCNAQYSMIGSATYTCVNGTLANGNPPTCSPTCATVTCSIAMAGYDRKLSVVNDTLCGASCLATCCEQGVDRWGNLFLYSSTCHLCGGDAETTDEQCHHSDCRVMCIARCAQVIGH